MSSLKTMVIGCLLAGCGGLALAAPAAGVGKGPARLAPKPAEVCSAMSVSKHFTLADADFGWVRDQLNATLARVPQDPAGNFRKAAGHRIPANATQFGLRLDHARCDAVQGPLAGETLRTHSGVSTKDCREVDCEDPLPGWTAPEGSTMAIWTCEGNVFREVVYERINGTWRVKSVREEFVVTCQVGKEPAEGKEPRDGKE
ncbi:hypothetical protein GCM10011521_06700 [Arenimonas soli]|uniref:Uncharacterized protein n=1 Tax=Arenimonas soli TaxID=2269504 RepID=A0ABQ1HDI9_9GAMM|nr:hypothetical protein [Arenimonas soli]GGA71230.1 hypothetical protein GCM10011521_06700 [Arenimonas soli]